MEVERGGLVEAVREGRGDVAGLRLLVGRPFQVAVNLVGRRKDQRRARPLLPQRFQQREGPAQIDRESRYNFVTRALKDWTQIFANFGLGVAAIKSIN